MLPDEALRAVLTDEHAQAHLPAVLGIPIVTEVPPDPSAIHVRIDILGHVYIVASRRASRARCIIHVWSATAPDDLDPTSYVGDIAEAIADYLATRAVNVLPDGSAFSVIPDVAPNPSTDTDRGSDLPIYGSSIEVDMTIRHGAPRLAG